MNRRTLEAIAIIIGFVIVIISLSIIINDYNFLSPMIVHGCDNECAEMMLGDNWTSGYVLELAEYCK
jgi:hypothetical protein